MENNSKINCFFEQLAKIFQNITFCRPQHLPLCSVLYKNISRCHENATSIISKRRGSCIELAIGGRGSYSYSMHCFVLIFFIFVWDLLVTEKKKSWNDIPSLGDLKIDWDYEPENPLGKRRDVRLAGKELKMLLGLEQIPIKLATQKSEYKGVLIDLAQNGLAVLLSKEPRLAEAAKLGMFLRSHKIISRVIVRNVAQTDQLFRVGLEFVELDGEMKNFIVSLVASKTFSRE